MKHGFEGKIISESIGLKSKMYYSLIDVDNEESKKVVNKNAIKNIRHIQQKCC